jgi:hypothetical protein
MPNLMQAQVRDERLGVPSMWNRIEDSYVPDVPVLSDRELRAGKEDKRLNFWWDGNATSLGTGKSTEIRDPKFETPNSGPEFRDPKLTTTIWGGNQLIPNANGEVISNHKNRWNEDGGCCSPIQLF